MATTPTPWAAAGNLWLVVRGNAISVVQSATRPAGAVQQVAAKGNSLSIVEQNVGRLLPSLPSGATIPANLHIPGFGDVGIGTSNPASTVLGTGQNLVTGGISGALGSPTGTSGTSVGSSLGDIGAVALRIGQAILAIVLLALGLHALTGQSSSPAQQVRTVRRVVPVPV